LQHTIACRRVMSVTTYVVSNIARLIRCPEAARLKWTVRDRSLRRESTSYPRLKTPNGVIRGVDVSADHFGGEPYSYGVPVLEWRRPGGAESAITTQGLQHTLVCRQVALA